MVSPWVKSQTRDLLKTKYYTATFAGHSGSISLELKSEAISKSGVLEKQVHNCI
jgi:hypothetical protein